MNTIPKNTPERIYLQVGTYEPVEDFAECSEVSWCQDKINDTDIPYVLESSTPAGEDVEAWKQKWKEANQFILDLAKELFGNDELGFDGISWSIEDFKNAFKSALQNKVPVECYEIKERDDFPDKTGWYYVLNPNDEIMPYPIYFLGEGHAYWTNPQEINFNKWLKKTTLPNTTIK